MAKGYRYYNEDGKLVTGTAALLHVINEDGGLEEHYEKVLRGAIREVIKDRNLDMASPIRRAIREGRTA